MSNIYSMENELFLKKLTEVADWEWATLQGESRPDGPRGYKDTADLEKPQQILLKQLKPCPCPHREGYANCQIRINFKKFQGQQVKVSRCDTCKSLITPKGHVIVNPPTVHNYPSLILERDEEDK